MKMHRLPIWPWLIAALLAGCPRAGAPGIPAAPMTLEGQVELAAPRQTQATFLEVASGASVSLIDASTGNTIASSVTNASGAFVLSFAGFSPTNGTAYVLEAVKGLSSGGGPNRAGAGVARIRSLMFWNGGWQSLTNSTLNTGIVVGNATTAVSVAVSLRQAAGSSLTLSNLIGKVNEGTDTFTDAGTGLTTSVDFTPVLGLVSNAVSLDQDPLEAIHLDSAGNSYRLAVENPQVLSITPQVPVPGGTLTIKGSHFDTLDGRNVFWFGPVPASTWSVSADRTTVTLPVPANAFSSTLTLQQPNGVHQILDGFLKIKGTVGTLAGNGGLVSLDGQGIRAGIRPAGMAIDASGNLYVCDTANDRLRKVTPKGVVTTLAGGTDGLADGIGTAAQFRQIEHVAINAAGTTLYVSDEAAGRIRKVNLATREVTTLRDSSNAIASFPVCTGIQVDAQENVYIIEYSNMVLKKITPAGVITTMCSLPTVSFGLRILPDGSGGYVNLYGSHQIGRLTLSGGTFTVTAIAGSGGAGSADGTGTAASFYYASDLAIEGNGNLLVADYFNNRIRRVVPGTGAVTTLYGSTQAYLDGPVATARFDHCNNLVLDPAGNIYVSDPNNGRIRVVTP